MPRARPPRDTLRAAQKEFARQRLIEAALECFEEAGYAATAIEDITAAAGTSRATFYVHFRNKADVVREALVVQIEKSVAEYSRLYELGPDTSWDDLRVFIVRLLGFWTEHRAVANVLNEAVDVDPEHIAATWSEGLIATTSVIARYLVDVRQLDEETARLRAMLLVAQFNRFLFFRKLPGIASFDDDLVVDELTDTWWRAFQPPVKGSRKAAGNGRSRRSRVASS